MRVIIISDSRDYMSQLRHMLARIEADVEVTEYNASEHGRPPEQFDWSVYDLLVIEEKLAGEESGLAWLAVLSMGTRLPATIMVASAEDTFISEKVGEMDRTVYVLRDSLDEESLGELVEHLGARSGSPRSREFANRAFDHDTDLVRKLTAEQGGEDSANDYKFVRLIGQGAQSRVYLAERVSDRLTLVLKVLDLDGMDDEATVKRFVREAELLASINSPYVVKFYGHGFTPALGYIAVEFFTRGDLRQRMDHGVSTEEALLYTLNIAYGLRAIHARDIVHRDLKPGNIMFRSDDSIALADFGISKRLNDSWDLTKTGAVIGTLSYLSPEQGLGRDVDQRSDLYSLGMMLFEMLTGRKAFKATSPGALIYQHLHADIPLLPDELLKYQSLIAKTLAKEPADRFQTADELIEKLQPLCS